MAVTYCRADRAATRNHHVCVNESPEPSETPEPTKTIEAAETANLRKHPITIGGRMRGDPITVACQRTYQRRPYLNVLRSAGKLKSGFILNLEVSHRLEIGGGTGETQKTVHQRRSWQARLRVIGAISLALIAVAGLFVTLRPQPATAQSTDSQSAEQTSALHAQTAIQTPQALTRSQTAPLADQYKIIGWNDLGMHCMNESFANLAVLPPYNTLWAQVIRQGPKPEIVTTGVTVEYSIIDNTYSAGKTDFWQHAKPLFGVDLAPNVGLTGARLSGKMHVAGDHFVIEGVPLTPYLDSAPGPGPQYWYPYQKAHLVAKDSITGVVLAETTTVAPVSTEMRCDTCHADGMQEGIATGNVETNILTLHDLEESTNLMGSRPVLCATCHGSNALGMPGNLELPNLSAPCTTGTRPRATPTLPGRLRPSPAHS